MITILLLLLIIIIMIMQQVIAGLGHQEQWLIPKNQITTSNTPLGRGGPPHDAMILKCVYIYIYI